MLRNSNLTKFEMLTLLSSNMTAPTLKTNEHLKKTNKPCFHLHFPNSNLKVFFSHFILNIKKNSFIFGFYTKFMCSITFPYSHDCHKSGKKSKFSKNLNFYEPNLMVEFFCFSSARPKTKAHPPDSQQ